MKSSSVLLAVFLLAICESGPQPKKDPAPGAGGDADAGTAEAPDAGTVAEVPPPTPPANPCDPRMAGPMGNIEYWQHFEAHRPVYDLCGWNHIPKHTSPAPFGCRSDRVWVNTNEVWITCKPGTHRAGWKWHLWCTADGKNCDCRQASFNSRYCDTRGLQSAWSTTQWCKEDGLARPGAGECDTW